MAGSGTYSITYDYTERNQLWHISGAAGENWAFTYSYDAGGNMISRRADYNNKSNSTNCPNDDYDALNRPRTWEQSGPNGFYALGHYQYDQVNREKATWRSEDNNRGEQFDYEVTNQLKKVTYNTNISPTPPPPSPTPPSATPTPPNASPTPNATPTPPGGTPPPGQQVATVELLDSGYPNLVSVTATTTTSGATIFYQINEGHFVTPTHNSNGQGTNGTSTYNGTPIHVAQHQVRYIRTVAYKAGWTDSVMTDLIVDNAGGGDSPNAVGRTVNYVYTPDKLNPEQHER